MCRTMFAINLGLLEFFAEIITLIPLTILDVHAIMLNNERNIF